jgi:hypothetical protein
MGEDRGVGTSAAGALVSNPENKRGVIKAFVFSSTSCLGTRAILRLFLRACGILGSLFCLELLFATLEFYASGGFWSTEKTNPA